MALNFPSDIIPNGMSEPTAIRPNSRKESPYTAGSQERTTASCLYEATFTFPPLTIEQMEIVRAIKDKGGEIIMPLYIPFQTPKSCGNIVVTSGSTGANLNVSGVLSAYSAKVGQFFSVQTGGRWYLYSLATASAAGATARTLTATQPLRFPPSVGNSVAFEFPYIQGLATWQMPSNGVDTSGYYSGLSVTIRESR